MNRKHKKSRIIFLGPLPPPYMGPSIATEIILNSELKNDFDLIHLDTSDHRDLTTLGAIDFWNIYLAFKHYCILACLIITRWPDVVYIPLSQTTVGYLRDSGFILIAKILRRKVICHLRGGNIRNWFNSANPVTRWYVRCVHSLINGQIVLGETLRHLFSGIVQDQKIFVIPNGRNFENLNIKKQYNRKTTILYLATFDRTKGILDVLNSVPKVWNSCTNVEFVFAGNWHRPDLTKEIKCYVAENPSLPITFFAPVYGRKKFEILNNADVFVFPPNCPEGHPWVIVEAMAAGLPIISTDQGAIKESVVDGVNGFIVEKRNPTAIAEKIITLIENTRLRHEMGKASRKLYEEKFTEKHLVENFKTCFNAVIGE